MGKKKKQKKRFKNWSLHLMLLPALLLLLIYSYIPLVGNVMAFQKFNPSKGFLGSKWVGLKNFRYVFDLPDIYQIIWNTFYIAILKIIMGIVIPVIVALLLNEITRMKFKRTIQTMIYFPHFLSWVILAGVFVDVLSPSDGVIGRAFTALGLKPIFFLGDPKWFPYTMVLTDTWKEFGYGTIVYLAALTGIDPSLYEAAVMDGAGHGIVFFRIILPLSMPAIASASIFNFVSAWNNLLFPLVFISKDSMKTISIGLLSFFGAYTSDYGAVMAAIGVSIIPPIIMYILLQEKMEKGLTAGAVKG